MVNLAPETPAGAAQPGRWERWRGPLLFASICLNLFLIGLMIGGVVPSRHRPHWFDQGRYEPGRMAGEPGPREPGPRESGRPGMPGMAQALPGGPGAAFAFRQAVQSLAESDRQVFEEIMEGARPELQRAQRELRQARQRVNEAVRADPFDKQSMLKALDDVRQRQQAIQQRLHVGTADALAKLSPEARRQFADALMTRTRP
jgi:uncharacterized membrane protein